MSSSTLTSGGLWGLVPVYLGVVPLGPGLCGGPAAAAFVSLYSLSTSLTFSEISFINSFQRSHSRVVCTTFHSWAGYLRPAVSILNKLANPPPTPLALFSQESYSDAQRSLGGCSRNFLRTQWKESEDDHLFFNQLTNNVRDISTACKVNGLVCIPGCNSRP